MEYQINISYSFMAENENEAKEKAKNYVSNNLTIRPVVEGVYSPADVAQKCKNFRKAKKEYFCVFFLDTQNKITGKDVISIGTLNASLIHPRETFRTAILKNCCSVIVAHNHPSGSLEPSDEDIAVTKRLKDAGKLLGIEVLDHVIVTADSYTSLRDKRLM
jgi:DNA repair protein RadC